MNFLTTSGRLVLILLLFAFFACGPISVACAQEWWEHQEPSGTVEDPVTTTKQELAQLPAAGWYDAEKDELARVPVTAPQVNNYRPAAPSPAAASTNWNWWPDFSWLGPLFNGVWSLGAIMVYTLVLVALGVIGYFIYRYLEDAELKNLGDQGQKRPEAPDVTSQVDRLESLPFQVKRPDSDLLAEAQRCYQSGDYNEAIVYLFSYELVELDKSQIIRLSKGKTNGQYLREIRKNLAVQGILEVTMRAFEDVFFGQRKLSRAGFERCWEQLEPFRQHLSGVLR